jgi:anti-sigma factor RsiW
MSAGRDAMAACDSEAARLLPWFVTGQLEGDQAERVEAHLAGCSVCRADLAEQRQLRDALGSDDRVEYSPQPSLQKLMTRIDELDREWAPPSPPPAPHSAAPARTFAVPRWLVAAVVVQTIGLAFVSSLLWQRSSDRAAPAAYQTLTSTSPGMTLRPQVRVVFAPGTTVESVAGLLQGVHARIVDGPSDAGAYALALTSGAGAASDLQASLARLRADGRIVFAEPIVEDAREAR